MNLESECFEGNRRHLFNIQLYIYEEDNMYVAYCPALDITSVGNSFNDATTNFHEHFQLYVETAIEADTLLDDLLAHGWKIEGVNLMQPTFDELLTKREFRDLMESSTQFDRVNARLEVPLPA